MGARADYLSFREGSFVPSAGRAQQLCQQQQRQLISLVRRADLLEGNGHPLKKSIWKSKTCAHLIKSPSHCLGFCCFPPLLELPSKPTAMATSLVTTENSCDGFFPWWILFFNLLSQKFQIWNWYPVHYPLLPYEPCNICRKMKNREELLDLCFLLGIDAMCGSMGKESGVGAPWSSLVRGTGKRGRERGRRVKIITRISSDGFNSGKCDTGSPSCGALKGTQEREISGVNTTDLATMGPLIWFCKTKMIGC